MKVDDEIHVWYVHVADSFVSTRSTSYMAMLSPQERSRHDRFVFEKDRRLFLAAHALLRTALSRYAPVSPEAWDFEENDYGKPSIAQPASARELSFNLSHTAGFAVCAVTSGREIGVDVEDAARKVEPNDLARRYFSASEAEELLSLPQDRQQDRFFDYWTLKEAYIKARGMGLSIPLGDFGFDLSGRAPRIAFSPNLRDDPASWQFTQHRVAPSLKIAVGVRSRAPAPVHVREADWLNPP